MTAEPQIQSTIPTTVLLSGTADETVVTLNYGPDLVPELEGLVQGKQTYDTIVVNADGTGLDLGTATLIEVSQIARKLLSLQGGLIIAGGERSIALVKESLMGMLSFHVFESMSELYDYSPAFARNVQAVLGEAAGDRVQHTDLSQQVLMSSVPVLTQFGIKLKAGMESNRKRNLVLAGIDNYSPLHAVLQRLSSKSDLETQEELVDEMKSLEQIGAIYSLFARIPFLVECFRNQTPFNLRDYLVASKLISQHQLDEMLVERQNLRGGDRISIGALAVSKGYISTRQLEVALQDLAFYGQRRDSESKKVHMNSQEQSAVQSLIGHLGTTDPAGLLQNLSVNRENGVLSVENRELQFRAVYENGRVTYARLGNLKGNTAVIEFASVWREGVFVFIKREPPPDLTQDPCKLTKQLDKLLLDAALAYDNAEVVWKKLPKGINTVLEKLPDNTNLFQGGKIHDPVEKKQISVREVQVMHKLWQALDGLNSAGATVRKLGDVMTAEAATAIDRLLHYELVIVPAMDLSGPLAKFRQIVGDCGKKIGAERNVALLRLSIQAAQGYSVRARMFTIGTAGEVGLDMAAARSAGTSLSVILKDLEDWQVKYIEYVSQDIDRNDLRDIVYKVHQK
jgi:hypothetical protein